MLHIRERERERERERTWRAGGDKREKGGDPSTAHMHAALPKPNPSIYLSIYLSVIDLFLNLTLTQIQKYTCLPSL